jgi:membrane associated rhomboid family serine protease
MPQSQPHTFRHASNTSFAIVACLFVVEAVDVLLRSRGLTLDNLGIQPRTELGLLGIVFSPLLHASWGHLLSNALPLLVLLTALFWDRHYHPWQTLLMIWFASGLGTWLVARPHYVHIGASSLVFGLVTYLVAAGILMRSWRSALVALIVLIAFGGIFYGVLPSAGPISWEGHLCGALAGVWAATRNHA